MASVNRRPLTVRTSQSLIPVLSPARSLKSAQITKRPRSPDSATHNLGSLIKRHKSTLPTSNQPQNPVKKERKQDYAKLKEQQRTEREQQRLEFKEKYRRAFPGWRFYLDSETIDKHQLESLQTRVLQLGGRIDPFFCREITHVISNRPVPCQPETFEKENNSNKSRTATQLIQATKSPVKGRVRQQDGQELKERKDLIGNALKFEQKIWNATKLESVLVRCLEGPAAAATSVAINPKPKNPHNLSRLLQSERIHGLSERDPSQKRHDFRYFSRGSYFILIEDMRGELSTIAAHEYPSYKEREGEKTPWPTLYCHPHARGPFIPFDDKEQKRWDRMQQAEEKEKEERRAQREMFVRRQLMEKRTDSRLVLRKAGDLRRSVSMSNMRNAAHGHLLIEYDMEGDTVGSGHAPGYLASGLVGYMAASGNSVGITSNTGTTSTTHYSSRNLQIPSNLSGRMRQEVIMRKQPQEKLPRINTMNSLADVQPRSLVLKKSKSTNTLKLPKREEGSKPGYCETCRQKFEDFKEHIHSRRHRKFAEDESNFATLDLLIERVQRRTLEECRILDERRVDICRQQRDLETDSDLDSIAVDA